MQFRRHGSDSSLELEAHSPLGSYESDDRQRLRTDVDVENGPVPDGKGGNGTGASGLRRGLKARHLQMITIGGTIGTGLFLGTGGIIQSAGPLGALIAYALVGVLIYGVMTSLGEMCTLIPAPGAISQLATRFVDPALGFTLGWNYWMSWAFTLPAELSAIAIVFQFWFPSIPTWVWALACLIPLVAINFVGVKSYGEVEFWLSLMKVVVILIFLMVGVALVLGANPTLGFLGFRNWSASIPGSPIGSADIPGAPESTRQLVAVLGAFTTAFYAYGGTELVGLTAGECEDPHINVPKAIRGSFFRIVLFYLSTVTIVGLIIPVTDPTLGSSNIRESPFTRVFEYSGVPAAATVMNAVIVLDIFSAANSAIYASSRTLMGLALEGKAPRVFGLTDDRGVPMYALAVSIGFGFIAFLGPVVGDGSILTFLINVLGLSSLLTWLSINVTHIRFRIGWLRQGNKLADLPFLAPLFPFADMLSLLIGFLIFVGLGVSAFSMPFDAMYDSPLYLGLPVFCGLYAAYAVMGTFGVAGFHWKGFVRFEDMDFETDRVEWRRAGGEEMTEINSGQYKEVGRE